MGGYYLNNTSSENNKLIESNNNIAAATNSLTPVSNPYEFKITKNYNCSAQTNFKSNFSFVCGHAGFVTGYIENKCGTLKYNNSGIYIYLFQALDDEYGYCRWWDNEDDNYASGRIIKVTIPSGKSFNFKGGNYIGGSDRYHPDLYNYIKNNQGKQLYFNIT